MEGLSRNFYFFSDFALLVALPEKEEARLFADWFVRCVTVPSAR
jgi:hypothetical protein